MDGPLKRGRWCQGMSSLEAAERMAPAGLTVWAPTGRGRAVGAGEEVRDRSRKGDLAAHTNCPTPWIAPRPRLATIPLAKCNGLQKLQKENL